MFILLYNKFEKDKKIKKPKVIIHNSVSLDSSIDGFEVNLGLHYKIVGDYKADIHLIGSNTAETGIKNGGKIPPEEDFDFKKPNKDKGFPYWVIPDTKGILDGMLHVYRRFEFCKDVVLLVSKKTSKKYIKYLEERDYDYFIMGETYVNYKKAFKLLAEKYKAKIILTDTGGRLNSILLKQKLVDEISLLVSPVLVGKKSTNLFRSLNPKNENIKLELIKSEILNKGYTLSRYKVINEYQMGVKK